MSDMTVELDYRISIGLQITNRIIADLCQLSKASPGPPRPLRHMGYREHVPFELNVTL